MCQLVVSWRFSEWVVGSVNVWVELLSLVKLRENNTIHLDKLRQIIYTLNASLFGVGGWAQGWVPWHPL